MDRKLEGKVIVIIGGTAGIGLSAAKACIEAGARVVAAGRDEERAEAARSELGERARVLAGDACLSGTAGSAIELAAREFGGFHGLYHVAGGSGRKLGDGPLHEITDGGWEETLRLNLTSLFYSNRAAIREFLRRGTGGSILNMASVLGFSPAPRHFATHAYAAAKAAVIGLTRSAAAHYAPQNIRFNAIAPALVETKMASRAAGDAAILQYLRTKQPLEGGRLGQASDLDAAAIYFLSDDSRYATGQVLAVDGGWSVSEGQHAE
ncbi:MAG: SDR family oxidoreductase [Planctomycetes bacterium]|nr:SDR family oxidoreductase [Planctomycetota bacterium]